MNEVSESDCDKCLPDCEGTTYEATMTAAPFRRCDYKNFNLSPLCKFEGGTDPPIWGQAVLEQYKGDSQGAVPNYLKFSSNMRKVTGNPDADDANKQRIFTQLYREDEEYNAYEKDIAAVTFFFEVNTAFEFERRPRMTLVDFISQVGGLLGLCMGFSLVSLVEIVYWFTIRMAKNVN